MPIEQTEPKKKYWEKIRELEMTKFPEFKNIEVYTPPDTKEYFYFSPSWYFHAGMITEADVKDLIRKDSKILSVGSGPAFLERMLADLGIKKENIILSDINEAVLPKDFKYFVFDMYGKWNIPEQEKYDLIIFPESTFLHERYEDDIEKEKALYGLISEALKHLKPGGEIRITHNFAEIDKYIQSVRERLTRESNGVQFIENNKRVLTVKMI